MIIAIASDEHGSCAQFTGCQKFFIIEAENGKIIAKRDILLGALANDVNTVGEVLSKFKPQAVLCAGFNGTARVALGVYGISLAGGLSGSVDDIAADFASGKLSGCSGSCSEDDCKSCEGCHEHEHAQ